MKTATKIPVLNRKRKPPTWKERRNLVVRFLLVCLITPFYYGWKGVVWFYETFLTEVYESGNNGIFGPGYHSWEHSRLSWGKLAFLTVIIFIILYLILK